MPERRTRTVTLGGPAPRRDQQSEDAPILRVVILADLRGRAGREAESPVPPAGPPRLVPVDLDRFDEVLARLEPRLELRLGSPDIPRLPIAFLRLDDFHPDRLHRDLEIFRPLRDIRRRLLDASTFAQAAAEWARATGAAAGPEPAGAVPPGSAAEADEATRRRLLGGAPARITGSPSSAQAGLDRLLRAIVAPYIVPGPDPRLPEVLRTVDAATAAFLRAILHHADFQALEATWRSIHQLVTGLETDAGIEWRLLDITQAELQADCGADGPRVVERLVAAHEDSHEAAAVWPLLVASFTFGPGPGDVLLLEQLGAIARRAGGPVLAGADPSLVGCPSIAEGAEPGEWVPLDAAGAARWRRLRGSALAPWIGLAMPRVLLRLPYGQRTDPVEAFDFDEIPSGREHEAFLWGNPAFACARLIASAFVQNGTGMEPGDHLELEDLPAAVYDEAGEPRLKPCAEALLTEAVARRILDAGAMPLLASSRRNAIRVLRFQSIAHPAQPLAGKWRQ
jgi:type VI secretion system protein ImpC